MQRIFPLSRDCRIRPNRSQQLRDYIAKPFDCKQIFSTIWSHFPFSLNWNLEMENGNVLTLAKGEVSKEIFFLIFKKKIKWSFPFGHNWYVSRNSSGAAVARIHSRFITLSPPSCEFTFISAKILNLPISDSPPANLKIGAWKFFPNSSNIADYLAWEVYLASRYSQSICKDKNSIFPSSTCLKQLPKSQYSSYMLVMSDLEVLNKFELN